MAKLGVNIDHVATVRQARRGREPDPVWAAVEAELGGADAITVHLREDRRHMQDADIDRLMASVQAPLNLEMATTDELVGLALAWKPAMVTLVPERRAEITTEGGLDVAGQRERMKEVVHRLSDGGLKTSAFIDADDAQIEAASAAGFGVCEIHTGPYANATGSRQAEELEKVRRAGQRVVAAGMQLNAGHGLNYRNVGPVANLTGMAELHIGHAIISRAILTGLREAVGEMKRLMDNETRS